MNHTTKTYVILFCLTAISTALQGILEQGVVCVPVADLIGDHPPKSSAQALQTYFNKLPFDGVGPNDCGRLHQALFHEIVTITERNGNCIKIQLPNIFYQIGNGEKQTAYWTRAQYIKPLKQLKATTRAQLPPPISFKKEFSIDKNPDTSIITLIRPWQDPKTKTVYSVGTRFTRSFKHKNNSTEYYTASLFNIHTNHIRPVLIPRHYAVTHHKRTEQQKRNLFVSLLRSWVKKPGIIPYVWGGTSYTKRYPLTPFITAKKNGKQIYDRPTIKDKPKTGFDCSGIIARAAQIVGIPFYYKNTSTMVTHLKQLTSQDTIENGDIIWIPGHVMVVSDIEHNLLIEAGSYSFGTGYIQEIPLHQQFKNINTYDELKKIILTKKPIIRLSCKPSTKQRTYYDIKILKLSSAWR